MPSEEAIFIIKKIIIDKDWLYNKYKIEKMTQKGIADYLGISIDTVVRNLREYNIDSNSQADWMTHCLELNEKQTDILNGAMLGDGSLVLGKNFSNAQFCYTSKSRQHVEYVCKEFMECSYKEGIKFYSYSDKRTNKIYERYTYRSISGTGFTKEYNRWYKNGIKHITKDLKLNPPICLIWYIGDGGICNVLGNNSQTIKIATNCFSKYEQENILLPLLKDFDARLYCAGKKKYTGETQYAIYIPKRKMVDFLDYIGECPFEDYNYKWNVKEKYYSSFQDVYPEWQELYLNGAGYTEITRKYGADNTTVLKYLRKAGVYRPFVGYKQFYSEWENRYLNGESYNEISKDYGCCSQTVLHHLRKSNIFKERSYT